MFTEADYPDILIISIAYQYINPSWLPQQLLGLFLSILCLVFCLMLMPESPKYLYINGRYEEVRKIIFSLNNNARTTFIFDKESPSSAIANEDHEEQPLLPTQESSFTETTVMPYSVYRENVIRMTIMWSAVAFSTYLLHFQLKYL